MASGRSASDTSRKSRHHHGSSTVPPTSRSVAAAQSRALTHCRDRRSSPPCDTSCGLDTDRLGSGMSFKRSLPVQGHLDRQAEQSSRKSHFHDENGQLEPVFGEKRRDPVHFDENRSISTEIGPRRRNPLRNDRKTEDLTSFRRDFGDLRHQTSTSVLSRHQIPECGSVVLPCSTSLGPNHHM